MKNTASNLLHSIGKAFITLSLLLISVSGFGQEKWQIVESKGELIPRHECAFVELGGKFYLLGGRGIRPVCIFNPETKEWTNAGKPPIELHHFQAINYKGKIYIAGAMTGKYPYEKAVPNFYIYDPTKDNWEVGPAIPEEVQRGGSGLVVYKNKFYLVCGIVNGHYDGFSKRFDVFDPATNKWNRLPDAPRFRDHFHAVVVKNKLYAIGGRKTSKVTDQVFHLTISEVDVYDFKTGKWSTPETKLPTERAGCSAIAWGKKIIISGGESTSQSKAHGENEVLDTQTLAWSKLPSFNKGRHGSQLILFDKVLYFASGSGNRGGAPELTSLEALKIK